MPGGTLRHPDSALTGAVCGGAWQGTGGGDCDTIGATTNIRRVLSASSGRQGHRLELRPDHRGTNRAISVAAPPQGAAPPLRGGYKCVFRRGQDETPTPPATGTSASSSPGPASLAHSPDTGPASAGIICPRGPGPQPLGSGSGSGPRSLGRRRPRGTEDKCLGPGARPPGPGPEAEPVEAGG